MLAKKEALEGDAETRVSDRPGERSTIGPQPPQAGDENAGCGVMAAGFPTMQLPRGRRRCHDRLGLSDERLQLLLGTI